MSVEKSRHEQLGVLMGGSRRTAGVHCASRHNEELRVKKSILHFVEMTEESYDLPVHSHHVDYVGRLASGLHLCDASTHFIELKWSAIDEYDVPASFFLREDLCGSRIDFSSDLISLVDSNTLLKWFSEVSMGKIEIEGRELPESVGLSIFKSMLGKDVAASLNVLEVSLETPSTVFKNGAFQLSLVGALLTHVDLNGTNWLIVSAVNRMADKSLSGEYELEKGDSYALGAALISIELLSLSNKLSSAKKIESRLQASLEKINNAEEGRFFLQFLIDTLSQFLAGERIIDHFVKLLPFYSYLRKSHSFVWPNTALLKFLNGIFRGKIDYYLHR